MSFKISIITATRNRRDYLPRCIESVANQSHPHKEHIIIDGGSTDGTVEVIESYAAKYPHIRWISERDDGISDAFNKGLALATGDAVGIIGDDDLYLPGALAIVAAEFERDAEAGMVAGGCEIVREDGSVWMRQRASFTSRADLIRCWKYWGNRVTLPAPSTFIRKRVIDTVGGFDTADRYAMDYRHWIKITEKFPQIRIVDQVLARFRYDEGTISSSSAKAQWDETLAISREYWGARTDANYYRMALAYNGFRLYHGVKSKVGGALLSSSATSWIVRMKRSGRSSPSSSRS